ncbi:hybrid sensor histidine kinase/response regulator [Falsiroseomonas selenitidurans]|uniref:histidine kinase n=1 Tax=Falsiroseomonas selenitidurans TaxID=2716335 RepID=A0ABX1DZ08_9PROT|nr:hybrid sensor histidine kinase/response regulator [Falsiroseomonas selenitidurans]NKC30108.1 hybrid sensor histidine kinase/response regulator [Falsiroseomonas selenitidurans]
MDAGTGSPPDTATDTPPLRVLVVDDERPIVEMLLRALTQRGFEVSGVDNPEAAKQAVREDPAIAVVLSDVRMPGQTGLALAEELLRDRAEGAALEVVLLTGGATADVALGALRARTFDLVQKPLRLGEVATVVGRALDSSRQRRARAARDAAVADHVREAEAERARLFDRLAASSARLDDAQSALAASQRVRRDLLAVVSHELRTPLIPILGFSQILAGGATLRAEEVRDYGRLIHEGAERLLALIEGALDIVALEHGRGLGPGVAEPAVRLLARAATRLEAAATARGLRLALPAADDPAAALSVTGDARLLLAALLQLLDNAIKASPSGAEIGLALAALADGGLAIRVLDRGTGLPPALLEQIGTPFLQADMSLTRAWPGAGLGLALAKRVATAHGGRLRLLPRPGGGTEARIELPAPAG